VPTIAVDSKGRITSASNTNITFPVTTVNGFAGTVVLTTADVAESGANQYFTTARAQAAITGTAPISVASGVVSISQSGAASNGFLSSTDWNTFNNKLSTATAASTYVPYTGATGNVNLGTFSLAAGIGSFTSSGSEGTFAINHTSGSGVASTITKGGNGEALIINKTSGSGNALSVTGSTSLTGALSGTTATFSGQVNSATKYAWGSSTTGTTGQIATDGTNNFFDYLGTLFIRNASASANRLILTSTGNLTIGTTEGTGAGSLFAGAATFSSTITAAGLSKIGDVFIGGRSGTYAAYTDGVFGDNLHFGATSAGGSVYINTALSRNCIINPVGGNVLIGTTTDVSNKVYIVTPTASNGMRIVADATYNALSIGGTGKFSIDYPGVNGGRFELNDAGTLFLRQYGNGTVTIVSGQVISTSNINLKNDDGGIEDALTKVLKLNPRYFYWKEDSGIDSNERQLGFYAQEVQEALGEEVANDNCNGKWGVNDRGIIAMLTKAMQEQQAQIEELKALIAAK
jgi:hypothetical protein